MRVTIFDYGAGNLHSLVKAVARVGVTVGLETDPLKAIATDVLILPGVGAFGAAADCLATGRERMRDAIHAGLPTLGICLGMQLLFDGSDEGPGSGLGLFAGRVTRLAAKRVPQMGWNSVDESTEPLTTGAPLSSVYYANGFACRPADESIVTAWTTHDADRFPAIVRRGRAVGVQFHPEKSSAAGVRFIRAFLDEAGR